MNSSRITLTATVLLTLFMTAACQDQDHKLTVGAKNFAEQRILAQIASILLQRDGFPVADVLECQDTFECQRMMREGQMDVMAEYTGTGLFYLGQPIQRTDDSLNQVRDLYKTIGLTWQQALGFDNGYRLLVTPERAAALGLKSINDLEKINGGVRVGCPATYLRRPRDGLGALLERHGLRLHGDPQIYDDINDRVSAMLNGRVDVIVTYATDGATADLNVVELEDSLNFFPPYLAAFVTRSGLADANPGIAKALALVDGKIDEATMRRLNHEVEVLGRAPRDVAIDFLTELRLIEAVAPKSQSRSNLIIAFDNHDDLGQLADAALLAARQSFPGRPVQLRRQDNIIKLVATGQSRLALMGAERFFTPSPQNSDTLARTDQIEAVAVVGNRMLHVIRRADDTHDALHGNIGAPHALSGAAIVIDTLLDSRKPAMRGDLDTLIKALNDARIDAVMIMATPGDPDLRRALQSSTLRLSPLSDALQPATAVRMPYARPSRLPANTYQGQTTALDTIATQVVLAAPAPQPLDAAKGGPVTGLLTHGAPLRPDEVQRLAEATRVPEAPDPALPSAWNNRPQPREPPATWRQAAINTTLNLLALIFLAALAYLTFQKPRLL